MALYSKLLLSDVGAGANKKRNKKIQAIVGSLSVLINGNDLLETAQEAMQAA